MERTGEEGTRAQNADDKEVQPPLPNIAPITPKQWQLQKPLPVAEMVSPPPKRLPESEMELTKNKRLANYDERVSTPTASSVPEAGAELAVRKSLDFVFPPPRTDILSIEDIAKELQRLGILVDEMESVELEKTQPRPSSRSTSMERTDNKEVQPPLPNIAPITPKQWQLQKPLPVAEMVSPPPKRLPESEMLPTKKIRLDERVSTPTASSVPEAGAELAVPESQEFVSPPPRKDSLGIEDIDQELKGFGIVVNEMELPEDDDDLLD